MHKTRNKELGIAHIAVVMVAVVVVTAAAFGGWYVWQKNHKDEGKQENNSSSSQDPENELEKKDETAEWVSVTTQGKAFSMKVPDGWELTNYPDNFLGGLDVSYKSGEPAVIETANTDYSGHSLRFRSSVSAVDDAGFGPQWSSPQPGLEESVQDFSIGTLNGKRYKGVFSGDLTQTVYEYVFDLGGGKKLDVVYTVYSGEKDDVNTVEKAIKTIDLGM